MDQFAVGMGKKDHAIFLDCATLEYELVSQTGDYRDYEHGINAAGNDSKRNDERFAETRITLKELQRACGYRESGRPHHRSVR